MVGLRQEWRTDNVISRISELRNYGLSDEEITNKLNEENLNTGKKPISVIMVKRVQENVSLKHREFLQTDTDYANLYKDTILRLIDEGRENLRIIGETRKQILDKLELIKKDIPDVKLMEYMREIVNAVKGQNDTIRTLNSSLERLETQQKEIKINQVQNIRLTLSTLRELERQGYLNLNPDKNIDDLTSEER